MEHSRVLTLFLSKLKAITTTTAKTSWSRCGSKYEIKNEEKFVEQVLKHYFEGNLNSFIRQLHMYGFKKSRSVTSSLPGEGNTVSWSISHHFFHRDHPELIHRIRRKKKSKPGRDSREVSVFPSQSSSSLFASSVLFRREAVCKSILELLENVQILQNSIGEKFEELRRIDENHTLSSTPEWTGNKFGSNPTSPQF
eukprot:snap_masked-scaffold_15-processed-gene-6.5-mRNA-1 protein AED:1.00 eAED:1.00 QI:0/0/0/0/1/1/2/0/195